MTRTSFSLRGTLIIVLISGDVILLPVPKSDFQDTYCPRRTAETMACSRGDPEFITCRRMMFDVVHLHDGPWIEDDPEFRTAGVRLQAESLSGVD
jgi:hypothetical protein